MHCRQSQAPVVFGVGGVNLTLMKRKSFLTIIATALAVTIAGCAWLPVNKIQSRAKGIAFVISAAILKEKPEYRDNFVQASADMKWVSEQEVIDVTTVMAVISRLPQLKTGDWAIYIEGALIFFADDLTVLAVKNPEEVKLAAKGFYQGIDAALGFKPPASAKGPVLTAAERKLGQPVPK